MMTRWPFLMLQPMFPASWRYPCTVNQLVLPSTQAFAERSKRRSVEPSRKDAVATPPGVVELLISEATKPRTVMLSFIGLSCLEWSCPEQALPASIRRWP